MMEFVHRLLDLVLHLDKHIDLVLQQCGGWSYLLFFVIIFAETGLVVTPFLPGDSLLFALGTFAAIGSLNVKWLFIALSAAAILGDSANYAIGKYFGSRLLKNGSGRFLKQEHLDRTRRFYGTYGPKTIVLARFVPIVRTFAPFVAGIGQMNYPRFLAYNVAGGILWIALFVFGGFYFGNIRIVKEHFSLTIAIVIFLSLVPGMIEVWKHRASKMSAESGRKRNAG